MTNSSPWKPWPIEIDGLPNLKIVISQLAMLNNQMELYIYICIYIYSIDIPW